MANNVGNIAEKAQEKVQEKTQQTKQRSEKIAETAGSMTERGINKLTEAMESLQKYTKECSETFSRYVKENPMKSLSMAVATGVVTALLLKRR